MSDESSQPITNDVLEKVQRKNLANILAKAAAGRILSKAEVATLRSATKPQTTAAIQPTTNLGKPLKNSKHEAVAQQILQGKSEYEAYRIVFKCSPATAKGNASAAIEKHGIRERLSELQRASTNTALMTMEEKRLFCARVKRLNPSNIDLNRDGDLIEEVTRDSEGNVRYKFPGKLQAIHLDAKLAGELIDRRDLMDEGGNALPSVAPTIHIHLPEHWSERAARGRTAPTIEIEGRKT